MFYAESLLNKLENSSKDKENEDKCKFPYKSPRVDPRILDPLVSNNEISKEELENMTNEDFLKVFSKERLKQKWSRKFPVNSEFKVKKFVSDAVPQRAKTARIEVRDILDADIFENKRPKWNNSIKATNEYFRVPLKKTIFEVLNGYNNFRVPELKVRNIPEGVDSRNICVWGKDWKKSTKLEEKELSYMERENLRSAKCNSKKYWKKYQKLRNNNKEFPIRPERKSSEEPRFFKSYKSPLSLYTLHRNLLSKAREELCLEYETLLKEFSMKLPKSVPERVLYEAWKVVSEKAMEKVREKEGKSINLSKTPKNFHCSFFSSDLDVVEKVESVLEWGREKGIKANQEEIVGLIVPFKPLLKKELTRLEIEEKKAKKKKKKTKISRRHLIEFIGSI